MKSLPKLSELILDTLCGLCVFAFIVAIFSATVYLVTHIYK